MKITQESEITLKLWNIDELISSPIFSNRKRALNNEVEEFIIEEAEEVPNLNLIKIKVYVETPTSKSKDDIASAIHRHFSYRRHQSQKEFKRNMLYGGRMLVVAVAMVLLIFIFTEPALGFIRDNRIVLFFHQSFVIIAWVTLWRPLELLIYDWYPIKKRIDLFHKLENSLVDVEITKQHE